MKFFGGSVGSVILMIVIAVGALATYQEHLLYHPTLPIQFPHDNQEGIRSPDERGLAYKNVTLTTEDDLNIHGWFMFGNSDIKMRDGSTKAKNKYKDNERPTLVFMHENAGNIGLRLPYYKYLVDRLEVNILSMAYRGYSYSSTRKPPSEEGLKKDADAIMKFLKAPEVVDEELSMHINKRLIWAHGRSLGGAVAIYMAHKEPHLFRGLIAENTFTSISAMADKIFPFIKPIKPYILRIGWYSDKLVPDLTLPVLYVTGNQDEIVPHEQTLELHKLTKRTPWPAELYVINGGTHNDSWYVGGPTYLRTLDEFIQKCISKYELQWADEWVTGQATDMLEVEKETAHGKVKIKTTVMPKGSLDKLKKEAAEKKKATVISSEDL